MEKQLEYNLSSLKLAVFNLCTKRRNLKFVLLLLLITANCQLATAQLYPVQTVHNVVPPYSTKLNDYSTSFDVKLRLRLILNDNSVNNRQVRLKLKIQGNGLNIQSRDVVAGAPFIFLNGGTQQSFTNVDLSAYFQLNNLIGINSQQYNKPLPDGSYKICWEVYDFLTNQLISNPNMGCDNVFLLLNDPPFLNLPQRGDQLTSATPFINFTWTPRHANATNVSYEFELREIWDNTIDPQAGFLASPNYYTQTTFSTTLLYGIGQPQLFPGRTYAWRVRAISSTGLSENSIFRNNGYSEIYYFTYANECFPPTMTLAEPLNGGRVKISWQTHPDHNKYHVQYKRADVNDAEWFEVFSYNNQVQIANLQDGVTYKFRVGGTCHALTDLNQGYSYTTPNQFTMPTADETVSYSCGIVPEIEISNTTPLSNLGINETFTAGDFPVTVKQIEGGNGTYSGVGFIVVPYLADTKIAVEFAGIKINTEYQLYDGIIKTTYDPTWSSVEDVGDLFNGGDGQVNITEVNFPIEEILIDPNGDILVVGEGGTPIVELPGGEDYVITDSNEQVWAVDEEGNVTLLGEQAPGGSSTAQNTDGVNSNGKATSVSAQGVKVTFTKAPNNVYGFDGYKSSQSKTKDLYKNLGNNYYIPYKGVAKGQDDYIIANLAISNDSIQPQDLIFKTKDGVALTKVDSTATTYTFKLTGTFDDADIETHAVIKQGEKYQIAGAFIQYQVALKEVDVVLVNTATGTNINAIKNKLNSIYKQGMVKLNVTEINNFDINTYVSGNTIESGESGFLANYTSQQQSINSAIKSRSDYKQNAYYLILTDKKPSTTGEKGLMPIGRQFGYIYDVSGKTIAHELGHGAFQLKHPFSTHSYGWTEKATNWLLDYNNGEHLPYAHWKNIHNPDIHIGIFDGDGESESSNIKEIPSKFLNSDKVTFTFMTLNGSYITIPKESKNIVFSTGLDHFDKFIEYPIGAITKFTLNNVTFKAEIARNSNNENITKEDLTFTYKGFKSLNDDHFYGEKEEEKDYRKFDKGKVIALIPHYTTSYNDPYLLSGTIESGYQLLKIPRADIGFSPEPGKQVTFNLFDDYTNISKFFSNYRSNPEPSTSYSYSNTPFNSQFNLQSKYVNPILNGFSWTDKHAILAKYAILNNAQPELFKAYFESKYSGKSYTDIFNGEDINKLKDIYLDLINFFSNHSKGLIEELHLLLTNTTINTSTLITVESVRINEILNELTTEQLKKEITLFQRETAITLLTFANGRHVNYGEDNADITTEADNKFENQIIRLLKFVVEGEQQQILSFLVKDEYNLFWKLINSLEERVTTDFLNIYTQYVNAKKEDRIKHRTDILTKLSDNKEDDVGSKTEKVFASIISNLEDRSKDQADLVTFFEANPIVIKDAFLALDNFVKVEELANFVFTICSWKVKLGSSTGINEEAFKEYAKVDYLEGSDYDEVSHIAEISKEHNYIPYYRESWIKSAQRADHFYLETDFSTNKVTLELYRYNHKIIEDSYTPLEYVYIDFKEDSSYEGHKFKKGTSLKVPALFIHWLDDSVDDNQNMALARIVGNIIAIASAPYTLGASLSPILVYIEVGANLIDMCVTINRQELIDAGGQQSLAYWDAAFGVYSLKDLALLPKAIVGIGKAGKGFINTVTNIAGAVRQNRVYFNTKNLDAAVEAFHALENLEDKAKLITSIDDLLHVLKYKNPLGLDRVTKLIKYRSLSKFRAKLFTEFNKASPKIIDIEPSGVDFKPYLVYKDGVSNVNLGTLEFDTNKAMVLSNSDKFLPSGISNTEELATISNVLIKTPAGSRGKNDINIVKNLDDSKVYIKISARNETGQYQNLTNRGFDVSELTKEVEKLTPDANLRKQSLDLFDEGNYVVLYKLFKDNNLNPYNGINWPPGRGFAKINKKVKGSDYKETIDRFQSQSSLGGGFGSPIKNSSEGIQDLVYTYDSRMLATNLTEGTYYVTFKMTDKATDVNLTIGDIAPWFSKADDVKLAGEQIEFSKGLHTLDKSYFKDVEFSQMVLGDARRCVLNESKIGVVTELQDVFNKLPKDLSDDIVDYINSSETILKKFNDAQNAGKLDELVEAYTIFRKNGNKTPCL